MEMLTIEKQPIEQKTIAKKNKKKKNKTGLNKETINIIRTTQRNNIDLTQLADNKANVLLSLNAIMITFLIPLILPNIDVVIEKNLFLPLVIFAITCFATILISAIVLKPSTFDRFRDNAATGGRPSPFFFGNFYKMTRNEFFDYMKEALVENETVRTHFAEDLFFVGRRLAFKMTWIRRAFNIFLVGLFLTLLSTMFILF